MQNDSFTIYIYCKGRDEFTRTEMRRALDEIAEVGLSRPFSITTMKEKTDCDGIHERWSEKERHMEGREGNE
jgi:hypothetical protein